ncbi:putative RNA-directed DNA polymerase, eukaryota, reverse transcriptase zinc-binding domain protein [Tanacetum coccineum]
MGDNEWIEVRRKNRGSVFNRLQFPHSKTSMMNDLAKVYLSVYVSNFPSHLTVRELWNICSKARTLVDVYIAKHKNALGQMFGFCRYIKVSNQDNLINSLCKIWIGKLRLYANVARFGRKLGDKPTLARAQVVKPATSPRTNPKATMASSFVNVARGSSNGEAKSPNTVHEGTGSHIPSIILSQDNSNDFPLALLGCYKDFWAIASTRSMCHNEGFLNVDFKYLGGLWVLFDFESSEARDKFLNHKGILTWFSTLKPWYNDFVVDERLVWLEIEGVPIRAWDNQVFNKICSRWGEVIFIDDNDVCNRLSKRLCIKSTHANLIFVSIMVTLNNVTYTTRVRELCSWTPTFASLENDSDEDNSVGDFFRNDEECNGDNDIDSVADTIVGDEIENFVTDQEIWDQGEQVISDSVHNLSDGEQIKHPSFSMLERLEETIKVGLALGLNMKGCEKTLASLINENGDEAETKMLQVDLWMLRQIWGNVHFDFASTSTRGMSGSIICLWNSLVFRKSHIVCNDNYVVIDGLWIPNDVQVRWIVAYAPQSLYGKITLWTTLENLLSNRDGISVIMDDFNEVRDKGEIYGSVFCDRQTRIFNEFIANNSLIDVSLGGYNFTWTNKWGTKMSKLDCFLVSESFYEMFPHAIGLVLEKGIPDHRPILIKEAITWKNDGIVDGNRFVLFKKKLQNLKKVIRVWIATRKADAHVLKKEHQLKLSIIDSKIDQGCASEEDFKIQRNSLAILGDLDRIEAKDFAQKAKIKWALEGDENTSFFHGTLKKKRRQVAIRGILKNGDWVDAPGLVKEEAVWECGGDRAPGPDGFTFRFFTAFWDTIEEDVVRFVQEFSISHEIPKGCNPSFIALIPKTPNAKFVFDFRPISLIGYILDGPLILNEILAKCGHQNKELLLFKVDFEKAFDFVRWDFLDAVMGKIGFGAKWRSWISGCLHKARSSILVNGSPTNEFELFKGLRQGDPLSPFLFILVMEGLHSLTCKAEELDLFKGVSIGCDNMNISYLMYADDGLRSTLTKASAITNIFTSKLSSWKARLLFIGGRLSLIKTVLGNLPTYFMSIYLMPVSIRSKLESMRSKFFRGADQNDSKMAWIKWEKCLPNKKKGGLVSMVIMEASLMTRIVGLNILLGAQFCIRLNGLRTKNQFEALGEAIRNVSLTDQSDSWTWSIGVGYSVASTRVLVDEKLLGSSLEATRWIRYIPIKVNVFLWRLNLNKLPSRVNLDRKGIEVSSLLCPTCQIDVETVNHIFFNCEMAKDLWSLLAKWCELDIPFCSNISDWYDWLDDACVAANIRLVLEGVGGTLMWAIWSFQNNLIFSNLHLKKATLCDFIVSQSFCDFLLEILLVKLVG